jgi:hypothetical protein
MKTKIMILAICLIPSLASASSVLQSSQVFLGIISAGGTLIGYGGEGAFGTITVEGQDLPPTVSSATIGTNGTTLTLAMSETVTRSGGTFDLDCSTAGNNITATYSSGSGSSSLVYTAASTINSGDTCNLDYNGASNGIEDAAGNDLAAITNGSVTNNSTQGGQTAAYFGEQTTAGASEDDSGGGTITVFYATPSAGTQTLYTCPGTGTRTIDKIELYGYDTSGTSTLDLGLYSGASGAGTLICHGSSTMTAGTTLAWQVMSSLTGTCTCTGGSVYRAAMSSGAGTIHWAYQSGSSGETKYNATYGSLQATMPSGTDLSQLLLLRVHVTAN